MSDITKIRTTPEPQVSASLGLPEREEFQKLYRYLRRLFGEFSVEGVKAPLRAGTLVQGAPGSAPDSAQLETNSISFYLDESSNKLKVMVKYSNGTVKTGEVSLV